MNNAGGGAIGPVMKATQEDIEKTFATNLYSVLYMTQAVVPVMPRGGRIINISSVASKLGIAQIPLYCAAKSGMDSLSFTMAMEVRVPF